ncbi:MAG: T9SS type A sorting domain-containing protein [Saprospiraceae bacterium]|nr:T9SS type A sorting domain-containing protein [Saprospiraceae bacterium]
MERRTRLILHLVFFAILFVTPLFAQNTDLDADHVVCKRANAHLHQFDPLRAASTTVLVNDYDLKYYRFNWYIDPTVYAIQGSATLYFEPTADNFQTLNMDLSTQLAIDSIVFHGQRLSSFTQSGSYALSIQLPAPIANGVKDSITIAYSGAPPSGGFGSFIKTTHNSSPIIWTLSEPFGSEDWWPCKNGLDDKIDSIDVYVTTPPAYRAASNGTLVEETTVGVNKLYHWKHNYAIAPYLVAIAVTDYMQYTDNVLLSNGTTMPMINYVYPESFTTAQTGTAKLVQVLQYYDSLFVSYPFATEKYGHAQFGWGGGMEHQTMSFVVNFDWGLLTHELAHQWFGDMVTCGSWEDIWLNEGFATYLEGISRERFPSQVGTQWYNWKLNTLNNIISQPSGSVKVNDTTSVNRIFNGRLTYNKGAYLLIMLRWKLGDEVFYQAVRNYLNSNKYATAKTPNFKSFLEAASGENLTEFFDDWYYGQGYPKYQLTWQQLTPGTVDLQVNQTTSDPSVDFFEMPIPVLFRGNGVDSLVRLDNTANAQIFTVNLPFEVTSISFDPDLWIVSSSNTVLQGALPVEIVYFKGILENRHVKLSWSTANERTNDHFEIEHSTDSAIFETIGSVNGKGTTNNVSYYDFIHQHPSKGANYYRLKQIDADGHFHYSTVVTVILDEDQSAGVYPNPSNGFIYVQLPPNKEYTAMTLTDALGRTLRTIPQSSDKIDVSFLPKGTYFIQVNNNEKVVAQYQFVKN